jgi:hypothetical protein
LCVRRALQELDTTAPEAVVAASPVDFTSSAVAPRADALLLDPTGGAVLYCTVPQPTSFEPISSCAVAGTRSVQIEGSLVSYGHDRDLGSSLVVAASSSAAIGSTRLDTVRAGCSWLYQHRPCAPMLPDAPTRPPILSFCQHHITHRPRTPRP